MATYRTKDGDMVDAIVFKQYGSEDVFTEMVLNANYGLADQGPILPAGIEVELPTVTNPVPQIATVNLWN